MRRFLTGVLALWLVAAGLLALAPAVAAADPGLSGTWISADGDGSTQLLAVGRGPAPAVTYTDFYASSCAGAGSPATHFVATGRGLVGDASLLVSFRNGGCGARKIGPFELGFSYDGSSDTLTDDFGITWYRYP